MIHPVCFLIGFGGVFIAIFIILFTEKEAPTTINGMTFCELIQCPDDVYEVVSPSSTRMYIIASTTNPGRTQNLYCVHKEDLPRNPDGSVMEYFIKKGKDIS